MKVRNDNKQEVRPIKAALLAWSVQGMTVQQILDKPVESMTIPEYAAYMHIRNIHDAAPGSRPRQFALEQLRMILDGLEPGQTGQIIPVTLIDRITESDGVVSRAREVEMQQKVSLVLPQGEPEENQNG